MSVQVETASDTSFQLAIKLLRRAHRLRDAAHCTHGRLQRAALEAAQECSEQAFAMITQAHL